MPQLTRITEVGTLKPGVVFLEVEAYGNGGLLQVGAPLVVVEEPAFKAVEWPRASRFSAWVRKLGDADKPQHTFVVSVPSKDGINIERDPADYSAFFVDAPGVEEKLRSLESIDEYRALAGI